MYRIVAREDLAPVTKLLEVEAPEVASRAKPGQFVIVIVDERGERIPLTIADYDTRAGTVTIIFQEVGKTTRLLGTKVPGDQLFAFTGPLGLPTEIERLGTVLCVGGGVGIAPIYPIARALKQAGNRVISIIGARTKELLFWEERMRQVSDELIVTTDDGSYGRKALVTAPEKEILESGEPVKRIWAIGPAIMMKFVSMTSRPFGVKTIVSLNSIMVDGTGMCGACRVEVDGKTRFVCVDGPEFDGHQVNWDLLMERQRIYLDEEKRALALFEERCSSCRGEGH
ncbi:MAG: sulfide/dihydroorotate dehydrogenase-like FAD/NAD-binding protein [Anaerolineae bacterium]|nr:sulfide/dihydroorotate dehydrogenase-like FAD/NAD-binding protein [Anaerolineae bacterium]